jgi:hypothetical protein
MTPAYLERKTALASYDVHTFDDGPGSTGHIAVVRRGGVPHLTGMHDNRASDEYQFLVPLEPDQQFEAALCQINQVPLGKVRELLYCFPESEDKLRELAQVLGLRLRNGR